MALSFYSLVNPSIIRATAVEIKRKNGLEEALRQAVKGTIRNVETVTMNSNSSVKPWK